MTRTVHVRPLAFPWETRDPFLFCAHHDDTYPAGNAHLGPAASLAGRNLGMDFEIRDGFRMYHGNAVPGFPQHPHRGFETVTLVRHGFIDHSDSMGATARFGRGDVQWMTAGSGIVHSEMFPLLNTLGPNRLELFQIWLNLPSKNKLVQPHFGMLWSHQIPRRRIVDERGAATEVVMVAGRYEDARPPAPPPHSWAADPTNDVAIWTLRMDPHARFLLPAVPQGVDRTLYFFAGDSLRALEATVRVYSAIEIPDSQAIELHNGVAPAEVLLLQGRPLREPVSHYGPFVMNTPDEIRRAFADYQRSGFGGWPWPSPEPVHPRGRARFAKHVDGREESGEPPAGEPNRSSSALDESRRSQY